ncbi:MAG TPA: hypothetical protein VFU25_11040 [Ornithinibacter sp.]|nr:hypothetical protein [Ornithinibacter sp.]
MRGTVGPVLSRMPSAPHALALLSCVWLAACGDADPPDEVVVTVTATPSTAVPPPASSAPAPSEPLPSSDVVGRRFDFGLVTGTKRAGDVDVLVVDRWTDPGVGDAVLAERGLEVAPWQLGSDRFVNQNDRKTFDVPVRDGVAFTLNHCVALGEPLQTRSVGAAELAEAPDADRLLLVRLDDEGWATGGQTLAGC